MIPLRVFLPLLAGLCLLSLTLPASQQEGRADGGDVAMLAQQIVDDFQIVIGGVARDGPPPTPTPTPIPTPTPAPPVPAGLAPCYEPRGSDTGGFVLQPAGPQSIFQSCQVIGYYGYPGVSGLGVLSQSEPDVMVERLRAEAARYDESNGPRGVVIAFHLIAAVAQADAGADGDYLGYMPDALIREWIAKAEQYNAVVILDMQMGTANTEAVVADFLPYLQDPRVHLAVDPEWTMPPGVPPGAVIGWMEGPEINRIQELMANYIAEHGLLDRMLIVHQFTDGMIRDKASIVTYDGVILVIDTDGFGYASQKIGNYNRYIRDDGAPHGGMKLFYQRDIDLMSPAEVNLLVPQPDFIVYE